MGTIAAMSNRVDLGEDETWVATLEARSYLYALFQILFGSEPTHERLEAMSTKATDDALCIWYGDESAIRHELAAALDTALEDDSEAAKAEFTRLFLGPAKLPVPVWETVFRDEEPFLFSKKVLGVRDVYRECGFLPAGYPSVADDHVALELGFLAELAKRALSYYDNSKTEECIDTLKKSADFLDEHALTWIPEFAMKISEESSCELYRISALAIKAFLLSDRKWLANFLQKD